MRSFFVHALTISFILIFVYGDSTPTVPKVNKEHKVKDPAKVSSNPVWIVNHPPIFLKPQEDSRDVSNGDPYFKGLFVNYYNRAMNAPLLGVDGEAIDAVEHFFWGLMNGVAIELGSLDGSLQEGSMTADLELLDWKRIIIEADPIHRNNMLKRSLNAFAVNAAVCRTERIVHYAHGGYVGGIVEFMSEEFVKLFVGRVIEKVPSLVIPGKLMNFSSLTEEQWKLIPGITPVSCVPLQKILNAAKVRHVNYFLLDVEGAEFEVLKSVNFQKVKFDVISVETESAFRPPNYAKDIITFLDNVGYRDYAGQVGRNHCKLSLSSFLGSSLIRFVRRSFPCLILSCLFCFIFSGFLYCL
jgi:hypothetical protein